MTIKEKLFVFIFISILLYSTFLFLSYDAIDVPVMFKRVITTQGTSASKNVKKLEKHEVKRIITSQGTSASKNLKKLEKHKVKSQRRFLYLDKILKSSDENWPVVVFCTHAQTGNCINTYATSLAMREELGHKATFAVCQRTFLKVASVFDPDYLSQSQVANNFLLQAEKRNMLIIPPDPKKNDSIVDLVAHIKPTIIYEIHNFENTHDEKVLNFMGSHNRMRLIADYQDTIRKNFRFKENLQDKAQDFLRKVSKAYGSDSVFVGFHIRRQRYVYHSKHYNGVVVPRSDYYNDALDHYRQRFTNVLFVVASDDLKHAKNFLRKNKDVVFSEMTSAPSDMALLASCNHSIMTVGSFGWWSSFLAGGDVVYAEYPEYKIPPFANRVMLGYKGYENFHGLKVNPQGNRIYDQEGG